MSDEDLFDDEWGTPPKAVQGPDSWFGRDGADGDEAGANPNLDMPHWTEPGTGEIPIIGGVLPSDDELEAWSTSSTGPRWRGGGEDFDEHDDVRLLGESTLNRPEPDEEFFFSFDEQADHPALGQEAPPAYSAGAAPVPTDAPPPQAAPPQAAPPPVAAAPQPVAAVGTPTGAPPQQSTGQLNAPRPATESSMTNETGGGDRDLATAAGVGLLLAAVLVVALLLGEFWAVVLVAAALAMAAAEFYNAVRQVGYHPATLAGVAVAAVFPFAVYWRGLIAYPVVMFLSVIAIMLWYLFSVTKERPVPNLAITMLGVGYVGVLGSFAALLLTSPSSNGDGTLTLRGTGLLFGAILVTVAYDIGAYFIGRSFGRSKLASVSPNKTIEGLVGGAAVAIAAAVIGLGVLKVAPWGEMPGSLVDVIILGVVAAIAATLGDLSESMIKRDLGLKDMGSILPGHGGLLDRFDALLFVLPATWCAAIVLGIAEPPPF